MNYLINKYDFRNSITANHIENSKNLILRGSAISKNGDALVLGIGKGSDVPLSALIENYNRVDIVDINYEALSSTTRYLNKFETKLHCYNADITGLIEKVTVLGKRVLEEFNEPNLCTRKLSEILLTTNPEFWKASEEKKYSFIVASCILTQLQASVRGILQKMFIEKFPLGIRVLTSSPEWREACRKFANQLEIHFFQYLDSLLDRGGSIYLSGTMKVTYLKASNSSDNFSASGFWWCTSKKNILDFLTEQHDLLANSKWSWIRYEDERDLIGRLYEVQAVIYKAHED